MAKKKVTIKISDTIHLEESIGIYHKTPKYKGKHKWASETQIKTETYRKTGEKRKVLRKVDRMENEYKEIIQNSDGAIVKEVIEPLTHHKGHGDAKKKRRP